MSDLAGIAGELGAGDDEMHVTVSDALRWGREASKCCDEHRKNLEHLAGVVEGYLVDRLHLTAFDDIRMRHVLEIVRDMERKGRSPSYIRHVINAIRLASNYMADYYGADALKIEQRHLPPRHERAKMWLSFEQLASACRVAMDVELRRRVDSVKSQPRPLELGRLIIMVNGLCGLRLTEFCRLTRDCLVGDRGAWELWIGASPDGARGRAKNETSRRVIPIPDMVADAMIEYWDKHGQWSHDRSSNAKRVRDVLRATAKATGDEAYLAVDPKDLRKSLVNELAEDVSIEWLIAYGGWAYKGELLRSYMGLKARPDDLPEIREKAVERLREQVVAAAEKKFVGMYDFG